MVNRVKIKATVGRQNLGKGVSPYEAGYVTSIRNQFKAITKNMEALIAGMEEQATDVIYEALEPTFQLSQKYVPVDTQTLKDSGFLEKDESGKYPRVQIGYSKAGKVPYAALVHEKVELRHAAPTRAKFLLTALEEQEGEIQDRIVKGFKQVLGT